MSNLSSSQFPGIKPGVNTQLSGISLPKTTNPSIGKVVTAPSGASVDMTQAQPAFRQSMRSFKAAQSAPNIGGVNKNLGQLVQHPSGGVIDFTQAKPAVKRSQ